MFLLPDFDIFLRQYEIQQTTTIKETYEHKVQRLIGEKFGDDAPHVKQLVQNESGGRWWAINASSGSCGLFQFYPCSKLLCSLEASDIACQIEQGAKYIYNRYGDGRQALAFWLSNHWY